MGIYVDNGVATHDLTVTTTATADIFGGSVGILAQNHGTGDTAINTLGNVTGGIGAINDATANNLTIATAAVQGGIFAENDSANAASVTHVTTGGTVAGATAAIAVQSLINLAADVHNLAGGTLANLSGVSSDLAVNLQGGPLTLTNDGVSLGTVVATARATAGWRHACGDIVPLALQAFAGSSSFTIAGVPIARDAAVAEFGFDVNVAPDATLGLSYGGQYAGHAVDQAVKVSFNSKF